jgi:hypothetical protein
VDIEADITRLNVNSVLYGALLVSLFEAHPNKAGVIKSFEIYAEMVSGLSLNRLASDAYLVEQDRVFQEWLVNLKNLSRKRGSK